MTATKRFAIITPYYKEDRPFLQRCIDSVKEQSVKADHFMIADGYAQSWIDNEAVRHIRLDRPHGDFGNTPRGVGALIAIAEEYDGIGLLDADNWLDKDHVEACLQAGSAHEGGLSHCDYVVAQRRFRRPDQTIMPIPEDAGLVDTNCFFFLRGSFAVVPFWATIPKQLSIIGDRTFNGMLRMHQFRFAHVGKPTVNYLCLWEATYRYLGEQPPSEVRPNIDPRKIDVWVNSLDGREHEIANRLAGVEIFSLTMAAAGEGKPSSTHHTPRNAPCPCGSRKKFKHCHGSWTT
jgi:hypothetical protein